MISLQMDSELHSILKEYLDSYRKKLSLIGNCDDGKYYLFLVSKTNKINKKIHILPIVILSKMKSVLQ